ncbi:hypothetical protein WN943_021809 [Citrus x changshan-huyou]
MEKMNHAFEKMKMLVGMDVDDEESAVENDSNSFAFIDDFNRQCTLTTKQRLYGFAICFSVGIFCTLLSLLVFFNPIKFGITFTFGNLLSLGRFVSEFWYYIVYGDRANQKMSAHVGMCYAILVAVYIENMQSLPFLLSSLYHLYYSLENVVVLFIICPAIQPFFRTLSWFFPPVLFNGSTAFLIGPKRQVTMMLDPARIYATAIYIASMIIALFSALYVHNKLLTLLALILEFGALIWYSLSYIPFARSMVSKIMLACFDTEF